MRSRASPSSFGLALVRQPHTRALARAGWRSIKVGRHRRSRCAQGKLALTRNADRFERLRVSDRHRLRRVASWHRAADRHELVLEHGGDLRRALRVAGGDVRVAQRLDSLGELAQQRGLSDGARATVSD